MKLDLNGGYGLIVLIDSKETPVDYNLAFTISDQVTTIRQSIPVSLRKESWRYKGLRLSSEWNLANITINGEEIKTFEIPRVEDYWNTRKVETIYKVSPEYDFVKIARGRMIV